MSAAICGTGARGVLHVATLMQATSEWTGGLAALSPLYASVCAL